MLIRKYYGEIEGDGFGGLKWNIEKFSLNF